MEEGVLQFWEERNIFKKSIEYRPEENEYVFYDGPPFATGLPHFGHIVPGTIKDTIPRYHTMKGRRVNRRFGWDCHGLPVEYEIERRISGYSAIVEFGVAGSMRCPLDKVALHRRVETTINHVAGRLGGK